MGEKSRKLRLQLAIWGGILIVIFTFLLSVLPVKFAFARALGVLGMMATVHYVNKYLAKGSLLKNNWRKYLLQVFLLLAVLSGGRLIFEEYIFPREMQPGFFSENPFRTVFFLFSALIVCVVSTAVIYVSFLWKKERELLQTIIVQNEARLQNLQSQIHPHFLFNSLNNIYSLMLTKSDKAPHMLLALTDLLRYSVYQKLHNKVSLRDEAKNIDFLIELFSLRRDEPYAIVFEKQFSNEMIEPMVLIPLVENCLKHCDFDLSENAYARMRLSVVGGFVHFETENTFNSLQQKSKVGGVGLQNIRERLLLVYADRFEFNTYEHNNIFKTELRLEWKK